MPNGVTLDAMLEAAVHLSQGRRRLVGAAWNAVRRPIGLVADPLVPYWFEGRTLRLPLSHDLPVNLGDIPDYGSSFVEVLELVASARWWTSAPTLGTRRW